MRGMSDGGSALDQVSQLLQPTAQPVSYAPTPAVNPNTLVNPYYMRAQPMDSLAPMSMYQNYKATGQMPAETSSFQPMAGQFQSPMLGGQSAAPSGAINAIRSSAFAGGDGSAK